MADHESLTVGANTVYRQRSQVAGASALEIARVVNAILTGSEYGLVTRSIIQGGLPTAITGNLLSTSGVGTTVGGDVSSAGNFFVAVSGTYGANMVVAFEASIDSANPASGNWFAYPGQRVGTLNNESAPASGVIGANAVMAWEFPAGAIIGFRVRLITVPATGTSVWRISLGTIPYDPSPVVSLAPLLGRSNIFMLAEGIVGVTTEALTSFFVTKAAVQAGLATQYTVSAGKTLHLVSMFAAIRTVTTATVISARARLRQGAPGGGVVGAGSPIIGTLEVNFPGNAAALQQGAQIATPVDIDVPAGQQVGMTHVATATTNVQVTTGAFGYEY